MMLIAVGAIFLRDLEALPVLFILLIAAVLFTAPLLILMTQVVRISARIPYAVEAKLALMSFMLALIAVFFYVLLGLVIDKPVSLDNSEFSFFLLATIASILLAVQLSKKSFLILIH